MNHLVARSFKGPALALFFSFSALSFAQDPIPRFAIETLFQCPGADADHPTYPNARSIATVHHLFREIYKVSDRYYESFDPFVTFTHLARPMAIPLPPRGFLTQFLFNDRFTYSLSIAPSQLLKVDSSYEPAELWTSQTLQRRLDTQVWKPLWQIAHCQPDDLEASFIKVHRSSFKSKIVEEVFILMLNQQKDVFGLRGDIAYPNEQDSTLIIPIEGRRLHRRALANTVKLFDDNIRYFNRTFGGRSRHAFKRCEDSLL